ncbi:MAG: hypothetical protein C4527_00655 [Candidatus Omnitrophota bacterium]|nr:MAG: hypothetical protein C4527_00655 [Candidatus Omnitrophota bacterium]
MQIQKVCHRKLKKKKTILYSHKQFDLPMENNNYDYNNLLNQWANQMQRKEGRKEQKDGQEKGGFVIHVETS